MNPLIKSASRVKEFGEVFTPPEVVADMLNLLPKETFDHRAHKTFLEPAVGTGNFTVAILERKLSTIPADLPQTAAEQHSVVALSEIYGIDLQADNITEARERMAALTVGFVVGRGFTPNPRFLDDVQGVVERNYRTGDFLKDGLSLFGAEAADEPQGQLLFDL